MKVAVFYSGFLRTWQFCESNQLANVFDENTDSYFFTYEKPEMSFHIKQFIQIPEVFYPDFIDLYKENMNPITNGVHNSLNQWGNQYIGFSIISKGYDIYVKSRPDIKLSGKIDFTQYDINDTNIYIPSGNDHWGGVNDNFAFGSYEVMKKYTSIYLEHPKIFAKGHQFHTEAYVTQNLIDKGVTIVRLPITNEIIR